MVVQKKFPYIKYIKRALDTGFCEMWLSIKESNNYIEKRNIIDLEIKKINDSIEIIEKICKQK